MIRTLLFSISIYLIAAVQNSSAAVKLQDVHVKHLDSGVAVDLLFDKPVHAKSLQTTFERNFVQLVLRSTKMDSAKLVAVSDKELQKVFAYPYSNDLSRVRLILKNDGDKAKKRISTWNNSAKSVRIFLKNETLAKSDKVQTATTAVVKSENHSDLVPTPQAAKESVESISAIQKNNTPEEKKILAEVVGNTKDININDPDSLKAALDPSAKTQTLAPSIGTKADPSRQFVRMAVALLGIIVLFVGCVYGVHRYAGNLKKLPFGKKERLIQVVATHYLGNKKSISLVKVTGEYMVVGVSSDSISLLSKLGSEVNVDKYLEDRYWGGTFEKHLDSFSKDKAIPKDADAPVSIGIDPKSYDGVRDLAHNVADKVQISPVRANIKEKLTGLKPLA